MTREALQQIFENGYPGKEKIYENLISPTFNKVRDLTKSDEDFTKDVDRNQIKRCSIFAQIGGGYPITFADVELVPHVELSRSRVVIQNCIRRIMENDSNAIIFFHHGNSSDEWRISFVHRGSSQKDSTNAKRYTYLCGKEHPARTVTDRFYKLLTAEKRIDDALLLEAFSVSTVSDEFFDEYKVFYEDFVQFITGCRYLKSSGGKNKWEKKKIHEPNKDIFPQFVEIAQRELHSTDETLVVPHAQKLVRDYIKKLMGRLVFLQFLQKKGWLGVPVAEAYGKGDRNFMQNLFEESACQDNFLDAVLEPLFFDTLNTRREHDVCSAVLGNDIKIPYLNGGLFERDATFDDTSVLFPKEFFSNPDKKEVVRKFAGEKERYPYTDSSGILDFFGRYNFTIDETDPYEQEIGVDPEMLGKIFENLLEDNKDKGAFYTPKEIVQYMCRESLIAYLATDSKIEENKIREFVQHYTDSFTEAERKELSHKLQVVKVCDPAVGSGAFPMGMLNELYACRHVVEKDASPVEIKKQIVKDNIYGVDIERGAVDIARLRFWLAIIVDEAEPLPLPNLDYKIMQGNSLLESYEGIDLSCLTKRLESDLFGGSDQTIGKLIEAIDGYFVPNDNEAKAKIRRQIEEYIYILLRERNLQDAEYEKLREIDLHANSKFFLWHTWFSDVFNPPNGCNGGFDIVIGNPPYGAKTSDKDKALYKKYYEAAKTYAGISKGSTDTFTVFVNLGYNLLAKNGNLAYIIPMAITSSDAMTTLHNILEKNCETIKVSSYSNRPKQIFDAACIRTSIFFFRKTLTSNKYLFTTKLQRRRYTDSIGEIIDGLKYIDSKELKLPGRYAKISDQTEKDILSKLFSTGMNIASYADEKGIPFYYRTSGGRYFNVVADIPTGSNKDKPYYVQKKLNSVIAATLSTTLFWFYCQVYTNGLDLKTPELNAFPLPDFSKVGENTIFAINKKYAEYLTDIENNVIHHSTFKEYKLRKSKKLIDQLDDLICPLYGLTKEETDFIKNYEIEFRLDDE